MLNILWQTAFALFSRDECRECAKKVYFCVQRAVTATVTSVKHPTASPVNPVTSWTQMESARVYKTYYIFFRFFTVTLFSHLHYLYCNNIFRYQ